MQCLARADSARREGILFLITANEKFPLTRYNTTYYTYPMPKKKTASATAPVSVILPVPLQEMLCARAAREDLTFSQIVRRALRKEFGVKEGAVR